MDTRTLNPQLLTHAYAGGYFPMPHPETEEILWYRPDPRAIFPLNQFHCSRSLRRSIRNDDWEITYDQAFSEVIKGCAEHPDTWINEEMFRAYGELFQLGLAHSVEVWREKKLVGGVYGVSIHGAFFAESKFHRIANASKVALYYLVRHLNKQKFGLLEVQFLTPHLQSLGACEVPDATYQRLVEQALQIETSF